MSIPSFNDACYAESCGMYTTYGTIGATTSDVTLSVVLVLSPSFIVVSIVVILFVACTRGSD